MLTKLKIEEEQYKIQQVFKKQIKGIPYFICTTPWYDPERRFYSLHFLMFRIRTFLKENL